MVLNLTTNKFQNKTNKGCLSSWRGPTQRVTSPEHVSVGTDWGKGTDTRPVSRLHLC